MHLEGLIFDIDGTLVDTNDLHAECWQEAFTKFGKNIEYEVIRSQIGKGGDLLVPDLLSAKEMRKFGEKVKDYRTDLYTRKSTCPRRSRFRTSASCSRICGGEK